MRSAARAPAGGPDPGIVPTPGGGPRVLRPMRAAAASRKAPIPLTKGVARPMLFPNAVAQTLTGRVDAMGMETETVLTFVVVLGLPLWLVAEELVHRFADKRASAKAVEPKVAAAPTTRDHRRSLERSSHIA